MGSNHGPPDLQSGTLQTELLPLGFRMIENFLSMEEEVRLLKTIDQGTWEGDGDKFRRVQQYGVRYDYKAHKVDVEAKAPEIPLFLHFVIERISPFVSTAIRQVFINEYIHHQGIGPHIDPPETFGPEIFGVSLGSPAVMRFSREGYANVDVLLKPRSLMVMTGESRYLWKHEIPYSKSVPGFPRREKGFRRISITLRGVMLGS